MSERPGTCASRCEGLAEIGSGNSARLTRKGTKGRFLHGRTQDWGAIEAAFHDRAVLVFPGQFLSDVEQASFGRRFGQLSIEVMLLSNRTVDGQLLGPGDPMADILRGNEGWHTDSSFKRVSAKASILSASEVPADGGETEWADMRAGYQALEPAVRTKIENLAAYHSLLRSQARIGADPADTARGLASLATQSVPGKATPAGRTTQSDGAVATRTDPLRPLVKVHPVTGQPALFVGRHAYGIPGLSAAESERLLEDLVHFACQGPRVLQHRWQAGDVVIWDNRCVLHRVRPWNLSEGRVMVHTRVAGDPITELAS